MGKNKDHAAEIAEQNYSLLATLMDRLSTAPMYQAA